MFYVSFFSFLLFSSILFLFFSLALRTLHFILANYTLLYYMHPGTLVYIHKATPEGAVLRV